MLLLRSHSVDRASQPAGDTNPGYRGAFKSRTLALAADLAARSDADRVADPDRSKRFAAAAARLARCAQSSAVRLGWRCGLPICPRCECRKAIRYRERLERRLRKVAVTFKHVTATVAADDLSSGVRILRRAFSELKRRSAWRRAVAGGEAHLQLKAAAPGGVRTFNVHFHAVVELRPDVPLDGDELSSIWTDLLGRRGAVGNLHVSRVERHWAIFRE
ncbi:MAG TPA: hypothetical protein VEB43_04565 [Anaeromyxobacter sp.]|nr:hypothetical protein [Anaeromyxobacter sp.]